MHVVNQCLFSAVLLFNFVTRFLFQKLNFFKKLFLHQQIMDGVVETFKAISLFEEKLLSKLNADQLRPILPCLTRMAFCPSLDSSDQWMKLKKSVLRLISHLEEVNLIVSLLSADFQTLENDLKKTFKQKPLEPHVSSTLLLDLESSTPCKKLLLFIHEFYLVQQRANDLTAGRPSTLTKFVSSELFDHDLYLDAMSDIICVLLAEMPHAFLLTDLLDTLLTVRTGPILICRLALNFNHSFIEICNHLLEKADTEQEDSFMMANRINVLRLLCKLNCQYALVIRSQAVQLCRMPALCVYLTIDHMTGSQDGPPAPGSMEVSQNDVNMNELVSFVSGILLGNDEKQRNWFSQYVRGSQKKSEAAIQSSSVVVLRQKLLDHCTHLLNALQQESIDADHQLINLIQSSALLKLYCALRGLSALKFTDEEVGAIVNLITIKPPPNSARIRFASIGLCMLLASPSLISTPENEKKIVKWLQWIVKEESLFGQVSGIRSSFCEMLLLIAIHFHSNQTSAIADLVSTVLGIKMPVRQNNLIKMKAIFTLEIFPDHLVTAHAIKVPVTNQLNSLIPGFLPVHCIYQLLKSRAFTKHKVSFDAKFYRPVSEQVLTINFDIVWLSSQQVPIKDWIFQQICNSSAPLNPVLPPLIETYVNSILIPCAKNSQGYTNEPISEQEMLSVFEHKIYSYDIEQISDPKDQKMDTSGTSSASNTTEPTCLLTTQLLLLYYLLWYEEVRLNQTKTIVMNERQIKKYSPEFLAKIPVYYLMQEARREQQNYGLFFPYLLKLISTHYSHLCLVSDWLYTTNHRSHSSSPPSAHALKKLKSSLEFAFQSIEKQPSLLVRALDKLLNIPVNCLWSFAKLFISSLPRLLPPETSKDVLEKAKQVWWRLNDVFPDEFRVMTVNAIALNKFTFRPMTWKDIVADPLQILRCDQRVFTCPEFMEILLHMLQAFLIASRTFFVHHLLETPSKTIEEEKEREELRFALLQTQESAAIQILLEACRDHSKNGQETDPRLAQVQRLVCVHLHQVFIADPNLAKLVHFQGYDSGLLSLIVSKVPSMHICLDFIPELLSQPDLNKQVRNIGLI